MSDTVTLEEIAQTDLGCEIIRQRDARLAAEQAEAEERRQAALDAALDELAVVAGSYDALRPAVVAGLAELGPRVDRLLVLRNQLDVLRSRVQRLGGELGDFPTTLMGTPEFKQAVAQARDVATKIGGAL